MMGLQTEDAAIIAAAALLLGAAGALQYSLSSGEKGINAFLMKEKSQNPFYSASFKAEKPQTPTWMKGLKLPRLDFVEVYGQERPQASMPSEVTALDVLYAELDAAIEREDYDKAAGIKARIDEATEARPGPP